LRVRLMKYPLGWVFAASARGPVGTSRSSGARTVNDKESAMTQSVHGTATPRVTDRRVSTETKAAVKTTEMVAFVVVTVAMLIAAQIVDGFDAQHAWLYASLLTIGYMISRGVAKSGSRDYYDDGDDRR
jgi:hypothetical protein